MSRYTTLETAGLFVPAGGIQFRTTAPIAWEVGKVGSGWLFTVPAGTMFDVSIPRVFWPILDPRDPRFLKAAALHDEMLRQGFDRLTAASAFNAAMAADGVGRGTRFAMTLAVAFYRFD